MICQLDIFKSIASLVNSKNNIQNDGQDLIDLMMGKDNNGRKSLVIEATTRTAYKKGNWVMIPPYKGPLIAKAVNIELGNGDEYLLFNLKEDSLQQNNLAQNNPEKLKELKTEFSNLRGKNADYKQIDLK